MSALTISNVFKDFFLGSNELIDPRMDCFPISSSFGFLTVLVLYALIVLKVGPKIMEHRKPFSLKNTIIVYNVVQIFLNAYIFVLSYQAVKNLNISCALTDKSNSETNLLALRAHYYYLLLKFLDLVETFFYVLRKKRRQISFLHVYHHIGILLTTWIAAKYHPGGLSLYIFLYNTLMHCIMYCYYLAASWSPNNNKIIWWKKYVTVLQIIQHCVIFVSLVPSVLNVNCTCPKELAYLFMTNLLVVIYLFVKFYKSNYWEEKKVKKA